MPPTQRLSRAVTIAGALILCMAMSVPIAAVLGCSVLALISLVGTVRLILLIFGGVCVIAQYKHMTAPLDEEHAEHRGQQGKHT